MNIEINGKNLNFIMICLQGWSLFSSSATKIASKATENAIKIGVIATQKVSDMSTTVGEKVCFVIRFSFSSIISFQVESLIFLLLFPSFVFIFITIGSRRYSFRGSRKSSWQFS